MISRFEVEKVKSASGDMVFLGLIVLLVGIGVSILFSASYYYADKLTGNSLYFFRRQLVQIIIGIVLAYFLYKIPISLLRNFIPVLVFLSFFLLFLTYVPGIGREVLGARRWINVAGFSFQPSELVKVSLVLYLSHIFSKKEGELDDFVFSILPPLLLVSGFVLLIYLQNDFSTAVFVFLIALMMFFVAGVRLSYFAFMGVGIISLSSILVFTKEHRVQRLITFLNPETDPRGAGYQVIAAKSALINGGLWGQGLGNGVKKLGGLPEAHSDFIFAVLAEEMGFIGVVFIICLFILFAVKAYLISLSMDNKFEYYIGFGFTSCIFFQAVFNISVVAGIVPATGIPLPFFSHGGSSILMTLIMCGILMNLSRLNSSSKEISFG